MPDETSLAIKPKPPSFRRGIAATRQQNEQTIKQLDPTTIPNRIGIVFDDSGSMSGDAIDNAHSAVKNFSLSCNHLDTSIAVYPINASPKNLICDYDILNMYVNGIGATGGTELYTKLLQMIENEPITRAVVFSDGGPTDSRLLGSSETWNSKPKDFALDIIKKYNDKEVPIDTIYIGIDTSSGYKEMQELAKLGKGIFIHFKDSLSLSSGLKYLAPRYRALLANAEIKKQIEEGKTV
jgi:hypothetical protein